MCSGGRKSKHSQFSYWGLLHLPMELEQLLRQHFTSEEYHDASLNLLITQRKLFKHKAATKLHEVTFCLRVAGNRKWSCPSSFPGFLQLLPRQCGMNAAPHSRELQVPEVLRQPMVPRFSLCELPPVALFLSCAPLQAFDSCIDAARHNWIVHNPIKQQNKLKNTTVGE